MKPARGEFSVFVTNLPYSIIASELVEVAARYGDSLSCRIPVDRATNKSCGYGYICARSISDAQRIAAGLNGQFLDGRELRASIGRSRGAQA